MRNKSQKRPKVGKFKETSSSGDSSSSVYENFCQEGRQKYWSDADTGESITPSIQRFLDKKVEKGELIEKKIKGKGCDNDGNRKYKKTYHTWWWHWKSLDIRKESSTWGTQQLVFSLLIYIIHLTKFKCSIYMEVKKIKILYYGKCNGIFREKLSNYNSG